MNADSLERLYRQYAPLVRARARRLVPEAADDVVQNVFSKLVQQGFRTEEGLRTWFYASSTNECLDLLRARARRSGAWEQGLREQVAASGPRDAEALLTDRELCRRLLDALPPKLQAVVVLVALDGMTQQEAADVLRLSRKTVNERLQEAKALARKWVTP